MPKIARYQEIHEVIRKRIFDGDYPVNSNLPSEAMLCREFSASRFTIREALRRLQADGLAERKQGSCGKVIRADPTDVFVQSFETANELLSFALGSGYECLSSEAVNLSPGMLAKLDVQGGEEAERKWLLQRGLRLQGSGNDPIALIETYISPEFEDLWETMATRKPPFYVYLEKAKGVAVTNIEQEIQALTMPPDIYAALGKPSSNLSLRILRRYKYDQRTLLASFNWHLGEDNFIFLSKLKQKGQS